MSNNPTADLIAQLAAVSGEAPTPDQWREIQAKVLACRVAPWGVDSVTNEPLPYPGVGGYYPEGYTRTNGPEVARGAKYYPSGATGMLAGQGNMDTVTNQVVAISC